MAAQRMIRSCERIEKLLKIDVPYKRGIHNKYFEGDRVESVTRRIKQLVTSTSLIAVQISQPRTAW